MTRNNLYIIWIFVIPTTNLELWIYQYFKIDYILSWHQISENFILFSPFQILTILKNPFDSWTKAMSKVAEDVVHRIFDHIPNESPDQTVDKELLIKCFLNGHSSSKASSIVKHTCLDQFRSPPMIYTYYIESILSLKKK